MCFQQPTRNLTERLGRVLVVGGGAMGQALCAALCALEGADPDAVCVANPGADKRASVERRFGVRTVTECAAGLPADTVILAVKPAKVPDVAASLRAAGLRDARVVSIAAGVSTASLEQMLGEGVQVVRVMPNTPLLSGCGMSGVSGGASASDETVGLVEELFGACGSALVVDESCQDAVTALSGSGPAYFELVCESLARAGEKLGLSYEQALGLVLETMYGTAVMLKRTHQALPDAIAAVSSPGGTTVAALEQMRSRGLPEALEQGVLAAALRSKELGV